jgi:hypothetical protein
MSAGYSSTPLARKVGLKRSHVLALLNAPDDWSIPALEPDVEVRRDLRRRPDVVIAFVRSASDLRRCARRLVNAISADGALWVAWTRDWFGTMTVGADAIASAPDDLHQLALAADEESQTSDTASPACIAPTDSATA